eukprot:gb/GFBE01027400.1/.p1 GENE.gb/GFBE01027400.1/~~gb/GFBE01027400.1/.p1  ORF type:complete len:595 (+),score=126.85 gb/GFBE01027400.1/:1-1785(+)
MELLQQQQCQCCHGSVREREQSDTIPTEGSGAKRLSGVSELQASAKFESLLLALRMQYVTEVRELRAELGQVVGPALEQVCTNGASGPGAAAMAEDERDVRSAFQEENVYPLVNPEQLGLAAQDDEAPDVEDKITGGKQSAEPQAIVFEQIEALAERAELQLTDGEQRDSAGQPATTLYDKVDAFLHSHTFETILILLLSANIIFMAVQMQIEGLITGYQVSFYNDPTIPEKNWNTVRRTLNAIDVSFTVLFAMDVVFRVAFLRLRFFSVLMNWIDFIVVVASVVSEFFNDEGGNVPVALRLLRLGKLTRTFRIVTMSQVLDSLQLLLKCLSSSVKMLFWTMCVLAFIQLVGGLMLANLTKWYIEDESKPSEMRQEVFKFYGTFSRTFLTMFEILFANWSPACRVLVENISEYYGLVFLVYRCIIGFAVLNVVSAVFVQQTMKIASTDEDLMFKRKAREQQSFLQMLQRLFKEIDASHDGYISFDEFQHLLDTPKLKFWMSQLEIDYHDLVGLFELLDDGDGRLSLQEFSEGISRLKGNARSIDVWRLETKVEALLAKVLKSTTGASSSKESVAMALSEAGIKHQRTTLNLNNE